MWPKGIVITNIIFNTTAEFTRGVVLVDVDVFRFQTAKPPFNDDIVYPAGLAIHALMDMIASQKADISLASELAALIGVNDAGDPIPLHCIA